MGLVQIGDNVQKHVNWICNCCSCCCEAFVNYRRLDSVDPVRFSSNFFGQINNECNGCGICINKCPIDAIHICKQNDNTYAAIDTNKCIGCGVCSRFCPSGNIEMIRKEKIRFVPEDSIVRIILNALQKNQLQNLIFPNPKSLFPKLLKRFLAITFSYKPVKSLLSNIKLITFISNYLWNKK